MDRQRFLIPMLALITMWRLALLPTLELSPDEALALFYSRHADLWHLEMGPLVPWLVKVSTWFFGTGELGVRFMAPVFALLATVCLWRLCRGVFDPNTAAWSVVVLQMVPAFNVAALSMTSSIVSLTLVMAFLLAFRQALHRAAPWDRMWVIAGVCLLLAVLADWRNGLAYLCAAAALWLSERRRHHLLSPGFAIVTLGVLIGLGLFVRWNVALDWPTWEAGELEPEWQVWPNVLRWLLLASPVLAALILWAMSRCLRTWHRLGHDDVMMMAFAVPFAVVDFAWGPRERWPHCGFLVWMVLGITLLMHHNVAVLTLRIQNKILLRSAALLLAGLQSMMMMRTDMVRSMGLPLPLARQVDIPNPWRSFLGSDPSSGMMAWKQMNEVLVPMLEAAQKAGQAPLFVIARNWQLAVGYDAYLPQETPLLQPTPDHPRIHVVGLPEREHALALMPRYDALQGGTSPFLGQDALYITDQPGVNMPPSTLRKEFDRWDTVNVVRLMHAGQEVRTIKIFACYSYKPPDL